MSLTVEKRKNIRKSEHYKTWNEKISGREIGQNGVPENFSQQIYKNKALSLDLKQELFEDKEVYGNLSTQVQQDRAQMEEEIRNTSTHHYDKTRRSRMKDAAKAAKSAHEASLNLANQMEENGLEESRLSDYEKFEANSKISRSHYEMQKNMAKAMSGNKDEEELMIEDAKKAYLVREINGLISLLEKDITKTQRKDVKSKLDKHAKDYAKILLAAGEITKEQEELYQLEPGLILDDMVLRKEIEKNPDTVSDIGEELSDYVRIVDIDYMSEMSDEEILKNYDSLKKAYLSMKHAKDVALEDNSVRVIKSSDGELDEDEKAVLFNDKLNYIEQMFKKAVYLKTGVTRDGKRFTALNRKMEATKADYNEKQRPVLEYILKTKNSERVLNDTGKKLEKKYGVKLEGISGKAGSVLRSEFKKLYEENKEDPEKIRIIKFRFRLGSEDFSLADGTKILRESLLRDGGIKQLISREPFASMSEKSVDGLVDKLCAGTFLTENSSKEEIEKATKENLEGIQILLDGIASTFDNMENLLGRDLMAGEEFISENFDTLKGLVSMNQLWEGFAKNKQMMDMYEKNRGKDARVRFESQSKYFYHLGLIVSNRTDAVEKYGAQNGANEMIFKQVDKALSSSGHDMKYDIHVYRENLIRTAKQVKVTKDPSIVSEIQKLTEKIGNDRQMEESLKEEHFNRLLRFNVNSYIGMSDEELLVRYDEIRELAAMGRMFDAMANLSQNESHFEEDKDILKIRREIIETLSARASLLKSGNGAQMPVVNDTKIRLKRLGQRYERYNKRVLRRFVGEKFINPADAIPESLHGVIDKYTTLEKPGGESGDFVKEYNKIKNEGENPQAIKDIEYRSFYRKFNYTFAGGVKALDGYKKDFVITEPMFRFGIKTYAGIPVFKDMKPEDMEKMMEDFSTGIFLPTFEELDKMTDKTPEEKESLREEIKKARQRNESAMKTFMENADKYYDYVASILGTDFPSPEFLLQNKDTFLSLTTPGQVFTNLLENKAIRDLMGEKGEALKVKADFYHFLIQGSASLIRSMSRVEEDDFDYSRDKGYLYGAELNYREEFKKGLSQQIKGKQ